MNPENYIKKSERLEKYSSKIILHFFRHAQRDFNKKTPDIKSPLSAEGKKQAIGKNEETNLLQSVAFGSASIRTQETAGLVMAGIDHTILDYENFDELKNKLNNELMVGSKIGVDSHLDIKTDDSTEYFKLLSKHSKEGDLLKFLVHESDTLAKKYNDKVTDTYSSLAKRMAEIIKKYLKIAPHWNKLVEDKGKSYIGSLERFFGTHQTMQESFLAKIIKKTKGVAERNKFIKSIQDVGFDYVAGFDIEILNTKDGQKIHILYKGNKENPFVFDEYITHGLLDEIIEEGEN